MTYIQGFVIAVPEANKQAFRDHAAECAQVFSEYGAVRTVETWGDDLRDGERTDFKRAVNAEPDEAVVFAWIEHSSKAILTNGFEKSMSDPRMQALGEQTLYDGQRMIFGGFELVVDEGNAQGATYIDGMLAPAVDDKDEFIRKSKVFADFVLAMGALRVVDCWEDDVPEGKVTDLRQAVAAEPGETIIMGWIEWPSRAVRDATWASLMEDERMGPDVMAFDPQRMINGGFEVTVDI